MLGTLYLAQLLANFPGDQSSLSGQKYLAFKWIAGMILDCDEAEAWTAVPRSAADIVKISGHCGTVYPSCAGIRINALAFVHDDHQEGRYKWKRDRTAQIEQWLERP
jgi:hypothetical protein